MNQPHLPNVRKNKKWVGFILVLIVAFFLIWTLGGGDTPAELDGDANVPAAELPAAQ